MPDKRIKNMLSLSILQDKCLGKKIKKTYMSANKKLPEQELK